MNATYTCGSKTIVIEASIVISSDNSAVAVGSRANTDLLKRLGFTKAKAPKTSYAKGLQNGRNYI